MNKKSLIPRVLPLIVFALLTLTMMTSCIVKDNLTSVGNTSTLGISQTSLSQTEAE